MRKCFSQDATEPATLIIETQVFTPVLTQQVHAQKNLGLFNLFLEAFVLVHDPNPVFLCFAGGNRGN